jgi:hypothetical protein
MNRRDAIEAALRQLAPRIPEHEFGVVVDQALDSAGLRTATAETAAWLALVSYVRHVMTEYDALLADGYDFESARFFTLTRIGEVLESWGVRRRVSVE